MLLTVTSSRHLPLPADQNPRCASAVHIGLEFTVISSIIAAAVPYRDGRDFGLVLEA